MPWIYYENPALIDDFKTSAARLDMDSWAVVLPTYVDTESLLAIFL
jgi:hypothetical protein